MRSILLKTILSIPLIVLKIIIIVFEGMKSIIERIGGFFLLLFIIPTIWTLLKKRLLYFFSIYIWNSICNFDTNRSRTYIEYSNLAI